MFQKGNQYGKLGRRKTLYTVESLCKALEKQGIAHGRKSFMEHLAQQAYEDNKVLVAVTKKILPDKIDNMGSSAIEQLLLALLSKRRELSETASNYVEIEAVNSPNAIEDKG